VKEGKLKEIEGTIVRRLQRAQTGNSLPDRPTIMAVTTAAQQQISHHLAYQWSVTAGAALKSHHTGGVATEKSYRVICHHANSRETKPIIIGARSSPNMQETWVVISESMG
jgi:hypothetical protein